jgi:hypothetical protein
VAAAAAAHGIPFACVPAGARNHFALDVGVGRHDVIGAFDAFTGGVERQIDIAKVNGRTFLNNVSLGIYGETVRSPAYRDAKVRTLVQTAAEVMGPSVEAPALRPPTAWGASTGIWPWCSCPTTPTRLTARWPVAPARRSIAASSGSSSSTDPATARSPPGRAWTAPHLEVSAPASVHAGIDDEAVEQARPCGSPSGRRRCHRHLTPSDFPMLLRPGALRAGPKVSGRQDQVPGGVAHGARWPGGPQGGGSRHPARSPGPFVPARSWARVGRWL